ncbi:MAG: L,D-transpeptidase [Lysobacter sp.]
MFAPGIGLAVVLAFHPGAAVAQSWAQTWPVDAGVQSPAAVPEPAPAPRPAVTRTPKKADFQQESASSEVKHVANWAVDSADNRGLPYVIVDKVNAKVFVFDAGGHLQGAEPALLGMVRGDRSAEGIGDQKLSAIRPENRTTPAGRFVASLDRDLQGQSILWIDYASALALHRVIKGKPSERRAERLQSATSQDNRISYGCINVPVKFFENVVSPAFTNTNGVVYILPETGTPREMFGSYDVNVDTQARVPAQP